MMDVDSLRADTPGCKTKIHFNNAGAALLPAPVIEAMASYAALEAVTGGYEAADMKEKEIEGFYGSMGKLLNCSPTNIAFASSATNAFARALSSIPFKCGDSILIANEDYISNQLAFLSLKKRFGIELLRAASCAEGGVAVDEMEKLMDRHHPRLVSLSHIPTNSGLIQPVEEVGTLCRNRNIPYLVDACQSAGQLPLDVKKIQCDFLTGTFRKFLRGPRGAGFLFVSDAVLNQSLEPLFIDMRGAEWTEKDSYELRSDARRFEDWELPVALVLGSKVAANYAVMVGPENIQQRNSHLCKQVGETINQLGLTTLDRGRKLSSIITVKLPGKEGRSVLQFLRDKDINTSISNRSSAVIDFDNKAVSWALRISPHYYNTEHEIGLLQQALQEFLN